MHGDDDTTRDAGLPRAELDRLLAEVGAERSRTDDTPEPAREPPVLPDAEARMPPPMMAPGTAPAPGAATWYRTDQDRNKSVFRRANPWYRRLARGLIGLTFLAAAGYGLYLGAREVQNWLNRDRLPSFGAEVPDIRGTSFQIGSVSPAPVVDGTLTLDTETRAFEFVGRAAGAQAGMQVVSPDGQAVYVRQDAGPWVVSDGSGTAAEVRRAVAYLADDDSADAILTNALRRGYVELRQRSTEGTGSDRLTRYDVDIDTRAFSQAAPLDWQDYQDRAIPGVRATGTLPATIWIDQQDVLVRVRVGATDAGFWSWQRLVYSDQAFTPPDPSLGVEEDAGGLLRCAPERGVEFATGLDTCAQAVAIGRELAVLVGLAAPDDTPGADVAFTTVCRSIQDEAAVRTALLPAGIDLATRLDATRVCPGDLSRLERAGS